MIESAWIGIFWGIFAFCVIYFPVKYLVLRENKKSDLIKFNKEVKQNESNTK